MKTLFIMLVLCFSSCLQVTKKYDNRIIPSKNSTRKRNSMKSASSLQNPNKVFPIDENLELESVTNSASKNRRVSIVEANNAFTDSKLSSQSNQNNLLVNPLRCVGSVLQAMGNFLLRRTSQQTDADGQQLNNHKHVYIVPTAPARSQNNKLYNQVNTRAYVIRSRGGNQASRVRQASTLLVNSVEMEGDEKIGNILKNVYSVVSQGHELLPDKYKSKLFKMLGNISSKTTSLSRKRTSKALQTSVKTSKNTSRSRARTTSTRPTENLLWERGSL